MRCINLSQSRYYQKRHENAYHVTSNVLRYYYVELSLQIVKAVLDTDKRFFAR
jgi:hypothetical protein